MKQIPGSINPWLGNGRVSHLGDSVLLRETPPGLIHQVSKFGLNIGVYHRSLFLRADVSWGTSYLAIDVLWCFDIDIALIRQPYKPVEAHSNRKQDEELVASTPIKQHDN